MYRLGLSETVLVFPEHHEVLRDVPLNEVVGRLRRAAPEKKLVIEVTNSETAVAAAVAGFDVVQAEKFAPAQIVSLVAQLKTLAHVQSRRPMVAAAGGVNAGNVAAYARAGTDITVTSSPYLARPCDVQDQIAPAGVGAQLVSEAT